MKDFLTTFTFSFIFFGSLVFGLDACTTAQAKAQQDQQDTWALYCQKYGVDPERPTNDQESYYFDCYMGSVEEEADLCNH